MKTVADYLYVGLVVAGLLAGLFLYRVAARRFVEWLIEQQVWQATAGAKRSRAEARVMLRSERKFQ